MGVENTRSRQFGMEWPLRTMGLGGVTKKLREHTSNIEATSLRKELKLPELCLPVSHEH